MADSPFDALRYCTEADVATQMTGDFSDVAPDGQVMAVGNDGQVDAQSWTINSASVDFVNHGITAGQVAILGGITGSSVARDYGPNEEVLEVVQALPYFSNPPAPIMAGSLKVKRLRLTEDQGQPIGGEFGGSGYTNVRFKVIYLDPQIADATSELRNTLNFSDEADLITAEDLRVTCAIMVAMQLYFDAASSKDINDPFWRKAINMQNRLNKWIDLLMRRGQSGAFWDEVPVVPTD